MRWPRKPRTAPRAGMFQASQVGCPTRSHSGACALAVAHGASHPPSMALAARATKPHPLGRPSFPSSPCNDLESRRSSNLPTLESVVSHSRHAIGKARAPSAPRRAAEAHGLVNANFSSERAPRRTHEPRPFEAPEPRGQDGVKPMTRVDHCGAHCATPAAAVEQTATPTAATSCTATAAGTVSPGAWAIGVALSFAGRGAAADRNGRGAPSNSGRWGVTRFQKVGASIDAGWSPWAPWELCVRRGSARSPQTPNPSDDCTRLTATTSALAGCPGWGGCAAARRAGSPARASPPCRTTLYKHQNLAN